MTIVVVGYIKDFKLPCAQNNENFLLVEGISERIDYIRANNLEKKESFTLIPKFVTNIADTGKQIMVFIQKIDILSTFRKKRRVVQFGQVQSTPFYDSRQILVTAQKLKDLFPINVLVINWGSIPDTIGYLKSADSRIYDIQRIFIHTKVISDQLTTFLTEHHFFTSGTVQDLGVPVQDPGVPVQDLGVPVQDLGVPVQDPGVPVQDPGAYIQFNNNKPNIKSLIFKEPSDLLEYMSLEAEMEVREQKPDIFAINWGIQMYLPFDKFFPCKDMTIYYDRKSHSERLKNTVLFGNVFTMTQFAKVLNQKRVLFLESLRAEGFTLASFN